MYQTPTRKAFRVLPRLLKWFLNSTVTENYEL